MALLALAVINGASVAHAEDKVTYDDHVAPIFRQRCGTCHNPTAKKADLDVTNYLKLMQGGASGAAISPGDADGSYLFTLVTHQAEPYMPQKADKLPDAEIDLLRRWINGGALENAGSKAAKPKPKMVIAAGAASAARPEVIPLPPRMVLEPTFHIAKPPMARSVATSPWAPLAAVASQRQVLLYNTKSLELVGVFPFPEGQPNVVRFSRDGRLLLAGGGEPAASGKVVVWDVTTGERVVEVGKELDAVLAADISANHKLIALGGPQRQVRVYSTETGELKYEIAKHTDWVMAAEFSPDGVLLATSDRNGGLCVWEAETGHEYLTLTGHTGAVNAVAWRGDSNVLASASEDATVCLWEMENGTAVKKWNAKSPLDSIRFTRDGNLVTGGRDGILRLWNQAGQPIKEAPSIGDMIVSVAFCDEAQRALAASWSGALQVFKADDVAVIGSLATNPPTLDERLAAANAALQQKSAASAPLTATKQKADADLKNAEAAVVVAQKKVAEVQAKAEPLAAEVNKIGQARAATEAERVKVTTTISQNEAARPLVGEALRQVTEALGKLPNDAKLAEVQRQLTEQQKAMEGGSAGLQAKLTELATAVANADVQLKAMNAQLEGINKEAAAAAEQAKASQTQKEQAAKALADAQKAAQPAEAELAAAQQAVARWKDEIAFRDQMAALRKELDAASKLAAARQAELDQANKQLSSVQSAASAAKKQADEAAKGVDAVAAKIRAARTTGAK
jgi:Planctomycete cytochrome C/WD domain, G-beta repeat